MTSLNGKALALRDVLGSYEDFLSALEDDRPIVEVPVPEWGGRIVLMRAMASVDRDDWEFRFIKNEAIEPDDEKRAQRDRSVTYGERLIGQKAQLVARCVVDRDGNRIFSETDAAFLQARNAAAIDRLAAKAQELCGFTPADLKKLEETRDAVKNANASPDDAASSG